MDDILLRDGEIIDPAQALHIVGSIAIRNGKIAALGQNLPTDPTQIVLDMRGKILTPGLIDLHCHPAHIFSSLGVPADEVGLNSGVTLLVDGGTAGAGNFASFRKLIIEPSHTEILSFLNIAHAGLIHLPEIHTLHDMDIDLARETVEAQRPFIKGIKVRATQALAEGIGLRGIEMAKKLAQDLQMPLMMHIGETRPRMEKEWMDDFSRQAVSFLEPGDILSHYLTWEPGGLILKNGTIYPELEDLRRKGIFLDACTARAHFSFAVARHALANGFKPSVISTDMAIRGLPVVQSLPVLMSKFLALGLTLDEIIAMTTMNPAKALREDDRRGSLRVGNRADITVFELRHGDFIFSDGMGGEALTGDVLLEPRMVFKKGEPRPAYSRYHLPPAASAIG